MSAPQSSPAPRPSLPALTLVAITLLLPMLSLVPLGSLWLWQNGYVIAWALSMLVLVSGTCRAVAGLPDSLSVRHITCSTEYTDQ